MFEILKLLKITIFKCMSNAEKEASTNKKKN